MRIRLFNMSIILILAVSAVSCGSGDPVRSFEPAVEGRPIYNAVCYGPHRDGQRPGGDQPSAGELLEDLRLIEPHWKMVRIYNSSEYTETFLEVIRNSGIDVKVILGVWIEPEEKRDEKGEVLERSGEAAASNRIEVEAGIRLANAYPDIVEAVCVGNETQIFWSAHRSPPDILIGHVRTVREGVGVPVTVADDFNFWNKPESRELAAEIDFIMMHAHPMWNGLQLEGALDWLKEQLAAVRALHPGRHVVVGETGWATSVLYEGEQGELIKGKPGEAEQKIFYEALRGWADSEKQIVFYFEAFDENWKGGDDPVEVEKHWGVFRADRSPKAAVAEGAGG